ncbi:MAG: hypothetical protein K6G28_05000 [Acholeplasmatales bacterium]|nr:hypothetical protein [Acholeplasmatales bacterium]
MKKEKRTDKYIVSRKILFLTIIILLPIIALLIYTVNGFMVNRITPNLKEKFEVEKINYVEPSKFNDFKIYFEISTYKEATSENKGSLTWKATFQDNTSTSTTNLNLKVVAADYWTDYTSTTSTKEVGSLTKSEKSSTSTISLDYENKNGWGFTKKVTNKPDIYVYMSYKYTNESGQIEDKEVVLSYDFNDVIVTILRA